MLKKILSVGTMALCMGAISAQAQINNDVYIDYSVLDELVGTNNPKVHNQPLFPEVKKAPRVKAPKPKVTPQKVSKPKAEVKAADKISLPEKVTIKEIVPQKEVKTEEIKTEVKTPILEPEKMTFEPIAPVETPTAPSISTPTAEASTAKAATPEENTLATAETEPKVQDQVVPLIEKPAVAAKSAEPAAQAPETTGVDNKIYFAEESASLTEADKKQIDKLLQSFGNPQENKIAINSYNFEDGKDVFKKKRRSLDRAIAVRSYLLSKKYKNFSIKVVNVTDDESKKNLVEIEEIK